MTTMTDQMVRKQIYLPQHQNLKLKRLAKQRGISEAEVIRQALEREVEMPVTIERDRKKVLENIFVFARSLRERPELMQGKPYVFNRDEIYTERENRW
jgi:tRNA A-37 threonylcarbamoyl transferase component Bud32